LLGKAKKEGKTSSNPLKESFGNRYNFKYVLLALFGAVMGQGVIWYTGQFYAMSFMQKVMNMESAQVDSLMAAALFVATPGFVLFGWLSDKVGRKSIMLMGMALAIIFYRPIYSKMYHSINIKDKIVAENGIEQKRVAKINEHLEGDSIITYSTITVYTDETVVKQDSTVHLMPQEHNSRPLINKTVTVNSETKWTLAFFVWIQVIFVTMVYGPIAAFLVEMFPVRIRYTSMSLPYHIGNGIFGGLLPAVATYLVTKGKEAGHAEWFLEGLWYPIIVSAVCFIIGMIYLDSKNKNVE